ncbi:hypothetical protein IC744_10650 [Microbacterium hominis]|uniref:hypothetical protein n=1 Tax=Microbacterium TaxID=33882 RepID=UPI00168BDBE1|nr:MULTISPECIES: hypothetical protein [Microbacterium]QOC26746.1 hypothetical protein IC745_04920 [Microbacterium hominis]QOC27923.1 hypothetical protein IC744_10650 [Microbacterium hominis]QYF96926.1 hypothetical protein KY498_12225 [Microbacterium sp. PAMC21962]
MPDYSAIGAALTTPEAFLALTDEAGVFGVKKQAKAALEVWNQAESRYVGAYRGFVAPGGKGTGFVIRTFWDPTRTTPDVDAITVAVQTALPVALTRADEKITWKTRNNKQSSFFLWQVSHQQALSQWFQERFGVSACATQLFDRADLHQDTAVVARSGGIDRLWSLTSADRSRNAI